MKHEALQDDSTGNSSHYTNTTTIATIDKGSKQQRSTPETIDFSGVYRGVYVQNTRGEHRTDKGKYIQQ